MTEPEPEQEPEPEDIKPPDVVQLVAGPFTPDSTSGKLTLSTTMTSSVYRIILDGSDNNTFIEVTDVGLVMNINPTLEEVAIGVKSDLSANNTYELNPGDYKITIYGGGFTDYNNNTLLSNSNHHFTVSFIPPYFADDLPDISNDVLNHVLDLSQIIVFPSFGIDDLIITTSTTDDYVSEISYDGGGLFTLDLSSNIQTVSIFDQELIAIILTFDLAYSSQVETIEKTLFITNVYKPPILTAPNDVTIRGQDEQLSYKITHYDTRFEDLSYNISTVGLYYGTLEVSIANISTHESSLDISFNLSPIDKTNVDISLDIIDESRGIVSQIERVILDNIYTLTVDEDPLVIEFDRS